MVVSLYHIRSSPFAKSPLVRRDEELMRKRRALAIRPPVPLDRSLLVEVTCTSAKQWEWNIRREPYRLPRLLPALLVSTANRTDRHYLRRGKLLKRFIFYFELYHRTLSFVSLLGQVLFKSRAQ